MLRVPPKKAGATRSLHCTGQKPNTSRKGGALATFTSSEPHIHTKRVALTRLFYMRGRGRATTTTATSQYRS